MWKQTKPGYCHVVLLVFGVESKLVTSEFEVQRQHPPTAFRLPFVIISFVGTAFKQTGSP